MNKRIYSKLEKLECIVKLKLPAWCISLPTSELNALKRHCEYYGVNPAEYNTYSKADFLKIRGIGEKGASEIIACRGVK